MSSKEIVVNYLYGSTLAAFSITVGYSLSWLMNSLQLNSSVILMWLEISSVFFISTALYGLVSGIVTWGGIILLTVLSIAARGQADTIERIRIREDCLNIVLGLSIEIKF